MSKKVSKLDRYKKCCVVCCIVVLYVVLYCCLIV